MDHVPQYRRSFIQNKPSLAAVATAGTSASLTGAPLATVYNNSVAQTAVKVWCGSAKTTGGQAYSFPTSTGASGGTALFGTMMTIHSDIILATTTGAACPCTSIFTHTAQLELY